MNSNKNLHHRRVITEVDQMPQHNQPSKDPNKKTERVITKPRFLDVYSKYMNKNAIEQKKNINVKVT